MAAEFLRSHGIDIEAELARIQGMESSTSSSTRITNVALPGTPSGSKWTVHCADGKITRVEAFGKEETSSASTVDGRGGLLAPSLCHPHIHLDKAFLLSHPKYIHLEIEKGDFQEAMDLTGQAKSQFDQNDLLERGQRVIDESSNAGVTHMRAFVELDAGVHTKCLDAGLELKSRASRDGTCKVQLCTFAQLPLFSPAKDDPDGNVIQALMRQAAHTVNVDVVGSTPYVESNQANMERNIQWMVDLSIEFGKHLDFHLDYNLNANMKPLVWFVIKTLKEKNWRQQTSKKTVVLGHCTRLTLWDDNEWRELAREIDEAKLPVSFAGLPTSDVFMMRTGQQPEVRGTLPIPRLVKDYGLNACIGVNNIGNAFTPQGSCDPISLACQGVAIYQAGTKQDAELLFECVSTRAKAAIGFDQHECINIQKGDAADLVLFEGDKDDPCGWHSRKAVSEAVYLYDHCQGRRVFLGGQMVPKKR